MGDVVPMKFPELSREEFLKLTAQMNLDHAVEQAQAALGVQKCLVYGSSRHQEQFGGGPLFSWQEWPDGRISDCLIDGKKVSPVEFRRARAHR